MCIINEPAEVHETELFVVPHTNGIDQLTVYANEVKTGSTNNMMLLPVPYPNTVDFINLEDYQHIFKDLKKSFYGRLPPLRNIAQNSDVLKVHDVGSYKATLVPTHADLGRINSEVFGTVQENIKVLLAENYEGLPAPFGYIICKLKSGSAVKYHPFAYRHKMASNKAGKKVLFVPTRHEHGSQGNIMNPIIPPDVPDDHEADWDHVIYSINTDTSAGTMGSGSELKTDKIPNFDIGNVRTINKKVIKGIYPNNDLIFGLA